MIRWEDVDAYVVARDNVVQAAIDMVDSWDEWSRQYNIPQELDKMTPAAQQLILSVRALGSLYADRGIRDPRSSRQQEAGAEQAHWPDSYR